MGKYFIFFIENLEMFYIFLSSKIYLKWNIIYWFGKKKEKKSKGNNNNNNNNKNKNG